MIGSEAEWRAFRKKHSSNLDHLIVQEYVNGTSADMYSIHIADRNSRIAGFLSGESCVAIPRYTAVRSWARMKLSCIIGEVTRIVSELGYTGIAEFEYRREPASGKFRLIEINPRCWSWIDATSMPKSRHPLDRISGTSAA